VIVQEDRIAAAACFLPLTVNPRLGKELGSRHRAAIGLTDRKSTRLNSSHALHDALPISVIVQEDRIAAAACFLPLTVNPRLGKELGSRHRAAIGLTEENDAVAIVVSEETGYISLVADGAIERPLTVDDLRKRLRMMMIRRGRIGSLLTAEPAQ